jgi:hypothetical protein
MKSSTRNLIIVGFVIHIAGLALLISHKEGSEPNDALFVKSGLGILLFGAVIMIIGSVRRKEEMRK